MRKQRTMFQMKFKVMVIKLLTDLRRKLDKYIENFNKKIGNTRKFQTEVTELKNTLTDLKNIL